MGLNDLIKYIKDKVQKLITKEEKEKYYRLKHVFKFRDLRNDYTTETSSVFKAFSLPENMSYQDALKVISFLTDKTTTDFGVMHHSYDNIKLTSAILEQFHFKIADIPVHRDDIIDICIESVKNMPRSGVDNWYTHYLKEADIKKIYNKLGLEVDFSKFDSEIKEKAKSAEYQTVLINEPHNDTTM